MHGRPSPDHTGRDERGAVLPSPVVWLSILAIAVAAVAFVTTRGSEPKEREITASSASSGASETSDGGSTSPQTPESDDETSTSTGDPSETTTPEEPEKTKQPVERGDYGVVVFNNTSIGGLAGETLSQVSQIGWNAVAADNWHGTIPATTVYFPPGMRDAAEKLALDLGIGRLLPADPAMSDTNLTVILTGPLA